MGLVSGQQKRERLKQAPTKNNGRSRRGPKWRGQAVSVTRMMSIFSQLFTKTVVFRTRSGPVGGAFCTHTQKPSGKLEARTNVCVNKLFSLPFHFPLPYVNRVTPAPLRPSRSHSFNRLRHQPLSAVYPLPLIKNYMRPATPGTKTGRRLSFSCRCSATFLQFFPGAIHNIHRHCSTGTVHN